MLGKIVQLLALPMDDGFLVYESVKFDKNGKNNEFSFAELSLTEVPSTPCQPVYCWGMNVTEESDGFKKFEVDNHDIANNKPDKELIEDRIWVIVPHSVETKTTGKRIAGRYSYEGIFELKRGDYIKVNKIGAEPELYMAVNAGYEFFLVKRTR